MDIAASSPTKNQDTTLPLTTTAKGSLTIRLTTAPKSGGYDSSHDNNNNNNNSNDNISINHQKQKKQIPQRRNSLSPTRRNSRSPKSQQQPQQHQQKVLASKLTPENIQLIKANKIIAKLELQRQKQREKRFKMQQASRRRHRRNINTGGTGISQLRSPGDPIPIEELRRRRLRLASYFYSNLFGWKKCCLTCLASTLCSFLIVKFVIEKNGGPEVSLINLFNHIRGKRGANIDGEIIYDDDDDATIRNHFENLNNNNPIGNLLESKEGGKTYGSNNMWNNWVHFTTTKTEQKKTNDNDENQNSNGNISNNENRRTKDNNNVLSLSSAKSQTQQKKQQPQQHVAPKKTLLRFSSAIDGKEDIAVAAASADQEANYAGRTESTIKKSDNKNDHTNEPLKKILYYTKYWNDYDFQFGYGQEPFIKYDCPVNNCYAESLPHLTEQGKETNLTNYDAVIFHMIDFDSFQQEEFFEKLQSHGRKQSQRYVMMNMESPQYAPGRFSNENLNGFFNWTMTYRLDSDIPRPYGYFQLKDTSEKFNKYDAYTRFINSDALLKKYQNLSRRPKKVAWIVSNCYNTPSKRELYVQELSKYIEVDIFGKCSNGQIIPLTSNGTENSKSPLSCNVTKHSIDLESRGGLPIDNCTLSVMNKYKFHLSFENAMCNDYITEKFYKRMYYNSLPIVIGKNDNYHSGKNIPDHSFVNVFNYSSPKELATYLNYLDSNEIEYLSYFWYKEYYDIRKPSRSHYAKSMCNLCAKLNDVDEKNKVYNNIKDWWIGGGDGNNNSSSSKQQCIDTSISSYHSSGQNRSSSNGSTSNNILDLLPKDAIESVRRQEAIMKLPERRMPW